MKKSLISAVALALLALPAMAFNSGSTANTSHRAEVNQQFARFDANGDGFISRGEFPGNATSFDRFDLNRDGAISRAEINQVLPDRASVEREVRGYDRNGDGIISRAEFPGNDNAFSRLDRNGDGVLTGADRGGKAKGKNKSHANRGSKKGKNKNK
jgi:EF hand